MKFLKNIVGEKKKKDTGVGGVVPVNTEKQIRTPHTGSHADQEAMR